ERSRYSDDVLLIGAAEMLMVVDGRLRVVSRASNGMEEPLEPVQEEALLVLMAETGNTVLEEIHPVEAFSADEGQGGSLERNEEVVEPSTPTTEVTEEPV